MAETPRQIARLGDARLMCPGCGARTSPTAGTIFDRTRTPLTVWWFMACWLFAASEVAGERFIDRETIGDMLFYRDSLCRCEAVSNMPCTHCPSATPTAARPLECEIEAIFGALSDRIDELKDPPCPACNGEGYLWHEDDEDAEGVPCQ